jgi:hypothetical protein
VLGTFDGFGHGETVTTVDDVTGYQDRWVEYRVPVADAIADERLFEVWIGATKLAREFSGDHWSGREGTNYLTPERAAPPEGIGAAGTRWGTAFNPAGR